MSKVKQSTGNNKPWLVAILLSGVVIASLYFVRQLKSSAKEKHAESEDLQEKQEIPTRLIGLTKEEAAARQGDFDLEAEIRKDDRQFLRTAIRQSLITTYNVDLFGIALILYLLGNPLAAIGTLLIVALNLILNVFQQMYTRKKLNQILKDLRPQAVVLRDGELESIEPALIVEGDYLVVREGDEFLVEGQLVGNGETLVEEVDSTQEAQQMMKGVGDLVLAGSYCLGGHAIYQASEAGYKRYKAGPASRLQLLLGELTPLQRFMEWVFRILFGLVILIGLLLVADSLITGANLVSTAYQDAFSILFGIAPTSLFFILIITYAIGALRISERGALVYEARSIETLADSSVLCISEESLVSGVQVDLELIEPPEGVEPYSENLVRQVLGDFVHSLPDLDLADQMLKEALPGEAYPSIETAPYLRNNGWQAASFDEPDLRGTLVLGYAEVLAEKLVQEKVEFLEESGNMLSKAWSSISSWLRRSEPHEASSGEGKPTTEQTHTAPAIGRYSSFAGQEKKTGLQKLTDRLDQLLSPMEDQFYFQSDPEEMQPDIHLIFAYAPETVRLFDRQDKPLLPENLIPISHVGITAVLRPEGEQTILDLVEAGLQVKMLSADAPEEAEQTARDIGLPEDHLVLVSGAELEDVDMNEFTSVIQNGNVLGDLTPSQKAAIVEALRQEGDNVVMVGNTAQDVSAMQAANLKIALRNSARAAMKLTDIVLLKDSLAALPRVIATGQRMVNGILDLFKLYLSQTIAQLLLVLTIFAFGYNQFPYHPTQAGVISVFTIALPGIFLSVWAAAGRVTGTSIRRQLAHFIIPSAITVALLSWGVYAFFISQYSSEEYAQLAVTYALLLAGWLRVLFVQPPTPFWMGGAPLRGDRRVIWVVLGSMLLFAAIISIPLFSELLRITWLRAPIDYFWIILAVTVWALITRAIWRSRWLERIINKI
ncbi:MAG: hypothetical protein AMJ56_02070 [Anaerolineae bacterium SG8_19]|jgi:magnesium-transporting ATPase (P-type)|nr:MAG: hypothetical protein AMJ56_02070 [Anaerolineae bacterium SG8_19]